MQVEFAIPLDRGVILKEISIYVVNELQTVIS